MDSNQKNLDLNKVLPTYLAIKSAGSDLYRIGLTLYPFGAQIRDRYHNPLIIFIFNSLVLIRGLSLFWATKYRNDYQYLLYGDWTHYFGYHTIITSFLFELLAFVSQIIHYWNFKNNIKPSYLKPFAMISGLVSPKSIGLTDSEDIRKLINRYKLLKRMYIQYYSDNYIYDPCMLSSTIY